MDYPMESRLHGAAIELNAPYVAEMVRSQMLDRYGEESYTAGYQVVTYARFAHAGSGQLFACATGCSSSPGGAATKVQSVDRVELTDDFWRPAVQKNGRTKSLRHRSIEYAPGGLSLALVTEVTDRNEASIRFRDGSKRHRLPWNGLRWAKPVHRSRDLRARTQRRLPKFVAVGDVIYVMPTTDESWALAQVPEAQSAVVSTVDPVRRCGHVALTGGFDYTISKFNRATTGISVNRAPRLNHSFILLHWSMATHGSDSRASTIHPSSSVHQSSRSDLATDQLQRAAFTVRRACAKRWCDP